MEPQANNPAYVRALEEWVAIKDFGPPNMVNYGGGEQRGNFAAGQSAMAIDWHDTGVMAQDAENSVVKEVVGYALAPGRKEVYNPKQSNGIHLKRYSSRHIWDSADGQVL
jgi:multiple sugar transport system substrate-binding protein